jgi:flagellar motor switch protein FliM
MTEVLSQNEIDQLLTAIEAGDDEPEDFRPARDSRKIKIYDFRRPDKFTKDQTRTVCVMHEYFARDVSAALSKHLKKNVHVHVASVDQLTYEEFTRCIPTPTAMAVLNMAPLKGSAVLEIDPGITFAMLKGRGIKNPPELTGLEKKAVKNIVKKMLSPLRESWSRILDLYPKITGMETSPQFCRIVPSEEIVILVTFECRVGDDEGMINLCFPDSTISPIKDKLTSRYWFTGKLPEKEHAPAVSLGAINIPVIVELGRKDIPLREIQDIGEGTIFELGKPAGEPVDVYANNVLVAKGEVVVLDGNYGVRVTGVTHGC